MVRVGISVEGLTEERFMKQVLAPKFSANGIFITPVDIGGNVTIPRVQKELERLAYSFDRVTTLYDFYGFKGKNPGETKESLELRVSACLNPKISHKVFPYIQMYEFEGILFSLPQAIANHVSANDSSDVALWANNILRNFSDRPETINDSCITAPSKRLETFTDYKKTIDGPNIAKEIGLQEIRIKCSGFNNWIAMIETWN